MLRPYRSRVAAGSCEIWKARCVASDRKRLKARSRKPSIPVTPRVARLARGVALGLVSRDYVAAAEALGESRLRVILAEVLPNMSAPLLAEAGLRLTYSIGLVAGIGFLGFATNPSAADWGLMIYENRLALLVQPWAMLAPVIIIGVFTIGTNLMADGIARLTGRGD